MRFKKVCAVPAGALVLREDGDGTSSWQTAGSPSITDGGNAVAMTIDTSEDCTFTGNLFPTSDNAKDLGSSSKRWQNIYTTDLHLAIDRENILSSSTKKLAYN